MPRVKACMELRPGNRFGGLPLADVDRGSNGTDLSAIACQILPFALCLSKGNEGFDKLSANENSLSQCHWGQAGIILTTTPPRTQ